MRIRGLLREKIWGKKVRKIYPHVSFKPPKNLIVLPDFKKAQDVDVIYPIFRPFVYIHVKWVSEKKKLIYEIIEPKLLQGEKDILKKIKRDLTEIIDVDLAVIKKESKIFDYLEEQLRKVLEDENLVLPEKTYMKISYYIYRDFVGFNEIEPILNDPYIEDITCDGLGIPVFVVHRKFGSLETNIVFDNIEYLNNFVIKLAERCGRYISYASPLLDGTLPDGSRVQATLAKDVTTRGPTFTIRKFRSEPFSPIDIINMNTASSEIMAYMWLVIESRASVLICGGTSTGKTTFLNGISMFIPRENKIVSIEDTRELNLPHENWIPSVSRVGFGIPREEGKRYGEVTLYELLKESFRQNPDYVIVGEVRGKEAYVLFQGMASGHASLATIHAGSADDVIKRLETPPINLSPSLIETLDIIIVMTHAKEKGESARRVKEITEIQGIDLNTGNAQIYKAFSWIPYNDNFEGNPSESHLLRRISYEKGLSHSELLKELENRKRVLDWMRKHEIKNYRDVCKLINFYYKDKSAVLQLVEKDLPPKL
jgi:flagellar protein FlaI